MWLGQAGEPRSSAAVILVVCMCVYHCITESRTTFSHILVAACFCLLTFLCLLTRHAGFALDAMRHRSPHAGYSLVCSLCASRPPIIDRSTVMLCAWYRPAWSARLHTVAHIISHPRSDVHGDFSVRVQACASAAAFFATHLGTLANLDGGCAASLGGSLRGQIHIHAT